MEDSKGDKKFRLEKEFVETTSFHGIARIADTKRFTILRVAWFLVFVICMCACGWTIYTRIVAFFDREVNTKVSRIYVSPLEFPAVTFCNFNR